MQERCTATRVFRYAPEFDMANANYDACKDFYIEYARIAGNATGDKDMRTVRNAAGGDVRKWSGSYAYAPVMHQSDGTVIIKINVIHDHQKRGRYRFAGHDFTIMETTNDGLFDQAVKFIKYKEDQHFTRPKLTKAAFNLDSKGSTYSQTLLIDHTTDTVTKLGRFDIKPSVIATRDGGDLSVAQSSVPTEMRKQNPAAYCTAPGNGFRAFQSIRVSGAFREFKPKGYDAIVDACRMWWEHQNRDTLIKYSSKLDGELLIGNPVPAEYVMRGIGELSPWARMTVATKNVEAMPRVEQHYYRLGFDSSAFFHHIGINL